MRTIVGIEPSMRRRTLGASVRCLALLGLASVAIRGVAGDGVDPFGTGEGLQKRTPGLTDPLQQMCEIPGRALTLAMAVDLALCRNPTTRAAWAAAHDQAALLGAAESEWLPQVSAAGIATHTIGQHIEITGNTSSSDQNTIDAALNLSWTLYDFGARTGRISNARHLLDAAAASASSSVQQTILSVVQAYYGLVAADAGLAAARTTESVTAHTVEMARTLRDAGPGTLADVLQAETAHEQAVLTRLQAEAAAQAAHGTFAVTLGLIADYPLKVDAAPVPAEVPALKGRMGDLMAEAMRQRPDLAAAQSQSAAAEADVQVARAAGLPVISINAGGDYITNTGIPNQHYGLIGINVSIPLFTGFNASYGVRRAKAALEASAVNVEQVRLAISLSVWNAYYLLESANGQLTATAGLAKTAEDNEQVAISSYQGGVGRFIDVVTAQSAAATARQSRISAELNWRVSRAELALALGRLSSVEPLQDAAAIP